MGTVIVRRPRTDPGCASGFFDSGPSAVETLLSAQVTQSVFATKIEIVNPTAGEITVSVYDKNNVPVIPPTPLGSDEVLTYTNDDGRRMNGGIYWQASAPGCYGYITGWIL